ncbi:MAG: response regulator transcription factor [Deltaproteobacteria bacterium]|nr:response regulator transcription factor [Deltaproteobacteria bacterium]
MIEKSRLVLVEDHNVLRQSLLPVLDREPDLKVVGEAGNGIDGIRVIRETDPDLVLLDLRMPKMDGTSVLREIKRFSPRCRVLMLTMYDDEASILKAFKEGVDGYCLKTVPFDDLLNAIRLVLQGKLYISPEISGRVMSWYLSGAKPEAPRSSLDSLTPREREVLKLVAEGHSNRQIAFLLYISVKTVEKHRSNLMQKLDLHSVSALTTYAMERGLVGEGAQGSPS